MIKREPIKTDVRMWFYFVIGADKEIYEVSKDRGAARKTRQRLLKKYPAGGFTLEWGYLVLDFERIKRSRRWPVELGKGE